MIKPTFLVAGLTFGVLHSVAMKKLRVVLLVIVVLAILVITGLFLIGYFSPKPGGIRIETTPSASVFINGNLVGETPFEGSYTAGTILLRLVPQGSSENLVPFETPITLVSGIQTAVGRTFGSSEESSSGYVISFEKTKSGVASLVVISQPSNAQVVIDGVPRGFSPYQISTISPAMHTISVKYPGFSDFSMTVKTEPNYRLTFYAKLGKGGDQGDQANNKSEKDVSNIVTILDTPTGYLRVRTKPGGNGEEIAQVTPGETFPYLNTDLESGWVEIQYQASKSGMPSGLTGWISGKYATVSAEIK